MSMNPRLLIAAMMAMAAPSELVRRIEADEKPSPEELSRKQKDEIALAKAQRKRERKAAKRGAPIEVTPPSHDI